MGGGSGVGGRRGARHGSLSPALVPGGGIQVSGRQVITILAGGSGGPRVEQRPCLVWQAAGCVDTWHHSRLALTTAVPGVAGSEGCGIPVVGRWTPGTTPTWHSPPPVGGGGVGGQFSSPLPSQPRPAIPADHQRLHCAACLPACLPAWPLQPGALAPEGRGQVGAPRGRGSG